MVLLSITLAPGAEHRRGSLYTHLEMLGWRVLPGLRGAFVTETTVEDVEGVTHAVHEAVERVAWLAGVAASALDVTIVAGVSER